MWASNGEVYFSRTNRMKKEWLSGTWRQKVCVEGYLKMNCDCRSRDIASPLGPIRMGGCGKVECISASLFLLLLTLARFPMAELSRVPESKGALMQSKQVSLPGPRAGW